MKPSVLLSCVLLFALSSSAQSVCTCLEEDNYTNSWEKVMLTTDTLSNVDSTVSSTNYLWDWQNSSWVAWEREVNTYSASGQVSQRTNYKAQNGSFAFQARTLFFYNLQGALDSSLVQLWSTNQQSWYNKVLNQFTYDASGTVLQKLTSNYDSSFAPTYWKNSQREDYAYNSSAQLSQQRQHTWNSTSNTWELLRQKDYYYSSSNKLDSLAVLWQGTVVVDAFTYTYDSNGRLLTELNWFNNVGIWEGNYKFTYSYFPNGKVQSYTLDEFNVFDRQWKALRRVTCSQSNLSLQEEVLSYSLYPNPTAGLLVLELPTNESSRIQVLDLQGKLLLETTATESRVELHLENLAAGTYLVDVQQGNLSKRQLLVLQAH